MKRCAFITLKVIGAIALFAAALAVAGSISPIYDFAPARPFAGPDIFNPYRGCDGSTIWQKANFHTHTRIKGPLNECPLWPEEVLAVYDSLGYDIVTLSNHNLITEDGTHIDVYEHGYNPFKYHLLVFGSPKVHHFDCPLPFTASQRQFILDRLRRDSDIIQINHPGRTWFTGKRIMSSLDSYRLIELDSGITTDNEYWDWALSAGHYSFAMANDDLHNPLETERIARRCNMLACPSDNKGDVIRCLLSGAFYSMRVPDYGNGNREEKYSRNKNLPAIRKIGLSDGGDITIRLSQKADSIRYTGQDSRTLALITDCDSASYRLPDDEPYARISVFFPDSAVIYTNPFARYDSSLSATPLRGQSHNVNILLTLIFNLALILLAALFVTLAFRLLFQNRNKNPRLKLGRRRL